MKKGITIAFTLLLTTLVFALIPTDAEARIYNDTLRLHILANSDSTEDQELKIKIRDKLLLEYGEELSKGENIGEAVGMMQELLPRMEVDVTEWIKELGYDYSCAATLTEEWYDTREYEDYSLPAGYYTSLRIIIGEGEGKNWWCVMYPPLCTSLATVASPPDDSLIDYTKEELKLIKGGGYRVKFKSLELLSSMFSKK